MDIDKIIINESYTIKQAIKKLDDSAKKILMVEDNARLKGVITDGDVRRWILKGGDLTTKVIEIINYNPIYITNNDRGIADEIMKKFSVDALPIVDEKGAILSIVFWDDIEISSKNKKKNIDLPVVIMAGGLGTRLYPYTKILPKPLIPIGDIPIVERIINKFRNYGCREFYLTVNYKKNMIKSYLGEIEKDYEVSYVEENKPLGTGGSLYLLKGKIDRTFFVSNCDILVDADYEDMYKYHKESKNLITIICAVKNLTIPYGVIELGSDGKIESMVEKPEFSFLTNSGMYIVEPEVLDMIPENKFLGFPDIIDMYRDMGENVGVYPITEKCWMDMGQLDEMQDMIDRLES